ncbi:MAG: DUF3667 domain-containing protein [Cyclobacteriaceae bacterium]
MKGLFDAFDLNNKVVHTFIGLFIKPGKLVNDYQGGNTKKYIDPFTTLIATVSLSYIISETNLLGFNLSGSEHEYEVVFSILWPALLTSIIVGLLPFTSYGWIRIATITLYSFTGFYIINLFSSIIEGYIWIYQFSDSLISIWVVPFSMLGYLLYFYFATFKGHFRSLLIYILIWFSIHVIGGIKLNEMQKQRDAINRLYSQDARPPNWSRMDFHAQWYSQNILSDSSYFDVDVNEDGIRDITIFMRDSIDNNFMLVADIRENKGITLNLNELLSVEKYKGITNVKTGNREGEKFIIDYNDGSSYGIFFNGIHFYGKKLNIDC